MIGTDKKIIQILKKYYGGQFLGLVSRLRTWYSNRFVIPSYSEKRQIILDYKKRFRLNTFVETGTFMGDTIDRMKDHFARLYSIELSTELAAKAKERFFKSPHVTILQGDSGKYLAGIIKKLNLPVLYWLDGHYSGEFFVGDQYIKTAKAEYDTPIMEELKVIMGEGLGDNVILIDDARCFNGTHDFPTINALKKFVGGIDSKAKVEIRRDVIRITRNIK
ncbi:MAG: hypothetical protein NTW13_01815 [Candidatus Omnitrophica bacterium]|nr:hypothetical protein [Candidatus Omnitrophota bacterium]